MGEAGQRPKPYRIIGAYDSETTNLNDGFAKSAFPILHQLGLIEGTIDSITADNVEQRTNVRMFRHSIELYEALDTIADNVFRFVPVICCHNLSFDMYGLAPWLDGHNVKVLAKSQQKPISFTILDDEEQPRLVIWDTLVFSQKSLGYMGEECGYAKLSGSWDYNKIRTPETPLTSEEVAYAEHDIYSLLAWLGYWCRLNPDISPAELGQRVVSKTGVVRRRRVQRFGKLRGQGAKKPVEKFWSFMNHQNMFVDDDELFTCMAATRGGFTFCARNNANRVFDFSEDEHIHVYGYDATSQHPSQMVSHRYPVRFEKSRPEDLTRAFRIISMHTVHDVLDHYERPFGVAFYGAFKFKGLKLKPGTLFERFGIAPLAAARCTAQYKKDAFVAEENQQGEEFREHLGSVGYRDSAVNPTYAFGKLEAADECILYLTELAAWEVSQAYSYDSVEGLNGYLTLSFDKPTDMCTISVMQFYDAKNEFKHAQSWFFGNDEPDDLEELIGYGIPEFVVNGMANHTIDDSTVKSTYLGLKADLNALFGIEACNEYRRDTVLGAGGIEYIGGFGIENAPEHPKAWYQCGQRIVGWSRIAQIIVMELCEPYIETIVNGDTDSVKFVVKDENIEPMNEALGIMNRAIDKAKHDVCGRVRRAFPEQYSPLDGIGYYVLEFKTLQFCAAWNKAYCIRELDKRDGKHHVSFTLAGVPCGYKGKGRSINQLADWLMESEGWTFGDVCDRFLGYNTTYSHSITGLNARSFPEWGDLFTGKVTDCEGNESRVTEPAALCLYPMAKTVNDTGTAENRGNMIHALRNRPSVKTNGCIVLPDGIIDIDEVIGNEP